MTSFVITGKKRGGPRQLAAYLKDKGENESITVRQIGSLVAKTVEDALLEMWAVADGCRAKDFLYHVTINPCPGVTLTQKQWRQAVDTLEKNLNFVGHQRVVVEHIKKGRTHYHVVWNRADLLTGKIKKLSYDRRTLCNTAIQLGQQFGFEPDPSKGPSFSRAEIERGKRTGIHPRKVLEEVTASWNKAKSGEEFIRLISKHGYTLARGVKCPFVIVDAKGSVHGLRRRIKGATAKTIKRGLADIDPKTLPTVEEVKAKIKAFRPARKRRGAKHRKFIAAASAAAKWKPNRLPSAPPPIQSGSRKGDKSGKTDGAGSGAMSGTSALKSSPPHESASQPIKSTTADTAGNGNGPERRRRNVWVPVERRRRPKPKLGLEPR